MPADRISIDEAARMPAAPSPATSVPVPTAPVTLAQAGGPADCASRSRDAADASSEASAAGPAQARPAPAPVGPAGLLSESGGLLDSLMTGMDVSERSRILGMISSNVEAEREAALDGRIRRQVDVGPRHRSRRREPDQDSDPESARSGPDDSLEPATDRAEEPQPGHADR